MQAWIPGNNVIEVKGVFELIDGGALYNFVSKFTTGTCHDDSTARIAGGSWRCLIEPRHSWPRKGDALRRVPCITFRRG
jgi:hypothetical protein